MLAFGMKLKWPNVSTQVMKTIKVVAYYYQAWLPYKKVSSPSLPSKLCHVLDYMSIYLPVPRMGFDRSWLKDSRVMAVMAANALSENLTYRSPPIQQAALKAMQLSRSVVTVAKNVANCAKPGTGLQCKPLNKQKLIATELSLKGFDCHPRPRNRFRWGYSPRRVWVLGWARLCPGHCRQ